ncbi:hypothetical protein [Gilvimarinus japonicus]|uniref:Uncharacterized protein n=1 Tax=Gilvimarinus japonicus TaxID=1796469 RepID=A0ABV7HM10_9GAMM
MSVDGLKILVVPTRPKAGEPGSVCYKRTNANGGVDAAAPAENIQRVPKMLCLIALAADICTIGLPLTQRQLREPLTTDPLGDAGTLSTAGI